MPESPSARHRTRRRSEPPVAPAAKPKRESHGSEFDRGILVGAGSSQIPAEVAMRVRDAAKPTAEDIAYAERETEIKRRNWKPPA